LQYVQQTHVVSITRGCFNNKTHRNNDSFVISEAGKNALDQLTGSLATDLSSECIVLVDAARDAIDGHKGSIIKLFALSTHPCCTGLGEKD